MSAGIITPEVALAVAPPPPIWPVDRTRQFAAIAFVDVADSTSQLRRHGDRAWSRVMAHLHAACAREITQHRGRMVKTMGDGLLATFPTASDAITALQAIRLAAGDRNLLVRGAVHAAEIERIGDDIAGLGVHVAARVEALTAPGELWVTSTVQDVIAGSGIVLDDRGEHPLRGFDEPWRLFAVRDEPACRARIVPIRHLHDRGAATTS